jgi:biopolymer transport protein ExbD
MKSRLISILGAIFLGLTCANLEADVLPLGSGTAVIKRVISAEIYGMPYRAYLVEVEGSEVVVRANPNVTGAALNAGDQIAFITVYLTGAAGKSVIQLVQTDAETAEKLRRLPGVGQQAKPSPSIPDTDLKIGKNGEISLAGIACSEVDLEKRLAALDPVETRMVFTSHPESKYDITVRILEILKKAGIRNVSFTADSDEWVQ